MGGFNLHFTPHYRFTVICEITIILGDLMEICFTPGWLHAPARTVTTRGHSCKLTAVHCDGGWKKKWNWNEIIRMRIKQLLKSPLVSKLTILMQEKHI